MQNKNWHILVVDDNNINRDLLSRQLEREGYETSSASDGKDALEKMRQFPVDIVLLDIMMPVMDGYQVLEAVHEDSALRHIPIIVISAVDDMESIVRCIQLGADDYLLKPFNTTLMLARIDASLEKKYLYDQLREEREKSESLLLNILPEPIAERLKAGESVIADDFPDVSVLFADIVNFTPLAATVDPDDLISLLNDIFSRFDMIANDYGLEKIKTIGDSYLVVGGLLRNVPDHPAATARMALDMMDAIQDINTSTGHKLALRIGIHVGPVVAGVVGTSKFFYDLWGDTVNVANRMETHGEVGHIHISEALAERLQDRFEIEERDPLEVKGVGEMQTYFLLGAN